jgi:hypothetical protein
MGNTVKNGFHKLVGKIILGLLTILSLTALGQGTDERILYVVDSIAIVEDPKEGEGVLSDNDIDTITVVTNKADINKLWQ